MHKIKQIVIANDCHKCVFLRVRFGKPLLCGLFEKSLKIKNKKISKCLECKKIKKFKKNNQLHISKKTIIPTGDSCLVEDKKLCRYFTFIKGKAKCCIFRKLLRNTFRDSFSKCKACMKITNKDFYPSYCGYNYGINTKQKNFYPNGVHQWVSDY
jgi:hypothetical protein